MRVLREGETDTNIYVLSPPALDQIKQSQKTEYWGGGGKATCATDNRLICLTDFKN